MVGSTTVLTKRYAVGKILQMNKRGENFQVPEMLFDTFRAICQRRMLNKSDVFHALMCHWIESSSDEKEAILERLHNWRVENGLIEGESEEDPGYESDIDLTQPAPPSGQVDASGQSGGSGRQSSGGKKRTSRQRASR